MAERHSGHEREELDWYVEPESVIDTLFNSVAFEGAIHDPCCGGGTIPRVARRRGKVATGADIVSRAPGFDVRNFFTETRVFDNIVTNPPFSVAEAIVEQARRCTRSHGLIAIVAQSTFLFSQGRCKLFDDCLRIVILSKRPSMPPGKLLQEHGEKIRGNGSINYCLCVWRKDYAPARTYIDWMM